MKPNGFTLPLDLSRGNRTEVIEPYLLASAASSDSVMVGGKLPKKAEYSPGIVGRCVCVWLL